jgi:uncharacterized protein YecT (DUF1311 family)
MPRLLLRLVPCLLASLLAVQIATAAEGEPSCFDDAADTPALNACLARRLQAQDAALAQAYERVRTFWRARDAQAEGAIRVLPALEASQAAWVQYRREECAARVLMHEGGTRAPSAGLACELALSRQRQQVLMGVWEPAMLPR